MLAQIRWMALFLALFFTVLGFAEYFFVEWRVNKTVETTLSESADQIAKVLNYPNFNLREFNKAHINAIDSFIALSDGSIVDIESSTKGAVKGVLPEVAFEGDEKSLYEKPTNYTSLQGEKWYLFAKPLEGGRIILGVSDFDEPKNPFDILKSNASYFHGSVNEVAKVALNKIDNVLHFAVIDNTGGLVTASGRLPLKTNPLLIGAEGFGVKKKTVDGVPYLLLRQPIHNHAGQVAGTIIVPQDVSLEYQALNEGIKFSVAIAAISWFVLFALGVIYWNKKEIEKREIREAFQNYFSPKIMEAILQEPHKLKLGGERREVTVLFSDIRGFTALSEQLPPQQLTHLLQEYFNEMTEAVMDTDGIVDKYIGDAVMAFWGAPLPQHDQADRAVTTAINMVSRLKKLNNKWRQEGYPVFDMGIGINLGIATVGNLGSSKRFDCTVVGDAVNAASRIESLNKEHSSNILISESTKRQLTIPLEMRDLGDVLVKGKEIPIRIYRIDSV